MPREAQSADLINIQETPAKVVGRRRIRDAFAYGMKLQASGARFQRAFGWRLVPKGVHRFASFEEADAWMTRILTRPKP